MPTVVESLAQAVACYKSGDLPGAEQCCRQALQADPVNVEAQHLLGATFLGLGKLDDAVTALSQAVTIDRERGEAHHDLGVVLERLGRLDAAIVSFEQAARLRPLSVQMAQSLRRARASRECERGNTLAGQGLFEEAVACYRRTLELRPDFADVHNNLGVIMAGQGRLREATACWRRAVELKPDFAEAYNALGAALGSLGEFHEAAASCGEALRLKPGFAEAHFNLGAILASQRKFEEAAASFRRALELKPDFAEAYGNLAFAAVHQKHFEEAITCGRRAVELKPDFAEAYNALTIALVAQNRIEEAAVCGRRLVALKPTDAAVHQNLGAILERQASADPDDEPRRSGETLELAPRPAGNWGRAKRFSNRLLDEAAGCYRRALELQPDFAEAHNGLGGILKKQGKLEEAAVRCRRALELQPDFAGVHNTLGVILSAQGNSDEAIACFQRTLELRPDFAEAYNSLAFALDSQDKLNEAADCCRRAVQLKPDFIEAICNLAALLIQQGNVAEAETCYRKALELFPDQDAWRLSMISLCPNVFGTRDEIEVYRRQLLRGLEAFAKPDPPFERLALHASYCRPSFNLQFHGFDDRPIREAYAGIFRDLFPPETPEGSEGRPRIGFLVTDRHESLFLRSLGPVLDRMDPDLFELIVIGSPRGGEILRAALRNPAIRVVSASKEIAELADAIRTARLDVLYYWEVGTDNANYFLPFLRLAPVQCTSWGIQVTSGNSQLDYYLSSALVESEEAAGHYTEKLILASTLLTYQQRITAPNPSKGREHFGIQPEATVYLCAQQLGKFQPDFDPLLSGILRQDARAVVVATDDRHGGFVTQQLRARFAATMPDVADRVRLVPFQQHADYLCLIAAADVLLDPVHFGGVNTTYDGLSLHKPIVTLPSRFQRGRYTLGCYKKMGMFDCVANDPQEYIDIAVRLGTDLAFRAEIEKKIQLTSPVLFEDLEAVREHERIFRALVAEARSARRSEPR